MSPTSILFQSVYAELRDRLRGAHGSPTVARPTHSLPFKGRAGVGMGATSLAIVHSTRFAAATEEGIANKPRRSKRQHRAGGIWGGVLYARY